MCTLKSREKRELDSKWTLFLSLYKHMRKMLTRKQWHSLSYEGRDPVSGVKYWKRSFPFILKWPQSTVTKTPSISISHRADGPSVEVCVPHTDIVSCSTFIHICCYSIQCLSFEFPLRITLLCAVLAFLVLASLSLALALWKWMQSRQWVLTALHFWLNHW